MWEIRPTGVWKFNGLRPFTLFICLFVSGSLCRLSTSPGSALSISRILSQAAVIRFHVNSTVLRSSRGVRSYCLTMMTLYMVELPVLYVQVGIQIFANSVLPELNCSLWDLLCIINMLIIIEVLIIPCFVSSRILILVMKKQWKVKM